MRVEGVVIEVYETWPLQLAIEASEGRYHVGLQVDTRITYRGHPVAASEIKVHRRITIDGPASGPNAMLADSIELHS